MSNVATTSSLCACVLVFIRSQHSLAHQSVVQRPLAIILFVGDEPRRLATPAPPTVPGECQDHPRLRLNLSPAPRSAHDLRERARRPRRLVRRIALATGQHINIRHLSIDAAGDPLPALFNSPDAPAAATGMSPTRSSGRRDRSLLRPDRRPSRPPGTGPASSSTTSTFRSFSVVESHFCRERDSSARSAETSC